VVDLSPSGFAQIADLKPGSGGRHNLLVTLSGADIAQLLSAHGLRPSRALGQNFVADPNTVRRIARLAGAGPGSSVLEFGAGLGSLTLALAETGARVVAVELDRHLLPVLRSVVEPAGVEVVEGDAMSSTWRRSWPSEGRPLVAWWPTCPTTWPPPWCCGPWSRCRR
jgi:protein-L-isoaspartate O-methyltransferase